MTATGSHEYFYSLCGAQPPGEGESQKGRQPSTISNRTPPQSPLATAPPAQGSLFLCSVSPYVDFYRAVIASKRAGRAAAPTRKIDTASRPSSGHFVATFPQGKAFFFATPGACVHIQQKTIGVPISRRTDGFLYF